MVGDVKGALLKTALVLLIWIAPIFFFLGIFSAGYGPGGLVGYFFNHGGIVWFLLRPILFLAIPVLEFVALVAIPVRIWDCRRTRKPLPNGWLWWNALTAALLFAVLFAFARVEIGNLGARRRLGSLGGANYVERLRLAAHEFAEAEKNSPTPRENVILPAEFMALGGYDVSVRRDGDSALVRIWVSGAFIPSGWAVQAGNNPAKPQESWREIQPYSGIFRFFE